MNQRIRHWLDNLPFSNPMERQQVALFQMVLIGWIVLAALGLLIFVFLSSTSGQQPPPSMPPMATVLLPVLLVFTSLLGISPVAALVVLRRGRLQAAVVIAALGLFISHGFATYVIGVTNGSVLVVYQIPIALAGLLVGRRLLLPLTSASIALVMLVGFLELQTPPLAGFFSPMTGGSPLGTPAAEAAGVIIMNQGFFVAITLLLALLLDRFGNALRVALVGSLAREEELNAIRASLETTVTECTAELQSALEDVRSQAEAQAALFAENQQQREIINDLSVPVIPVTSDTLVMPLVGSLDTARLQTL